MSVSVSQQALRGKFLLPLLHQFIMPSASPYCLSTDRHIGYGGKEFSAPKDIHWTDLCILGFGAEILKEPDATNLTALGAAQDIFLPVFKRQNGIFTPVGLPV